MAAEDSPTVILAIVRYFAEQVSSSPCLPMIADFADYPDRPAPRFL